MAEKYWIKLYHEIIDDPKMALLPDRQWRLIIELFLLAGRNDDDGSLPPTAHIAWMLRRQESEIESDMNELKKTGIVEQTETGWVIPKFSERQSASTNAERGKRYREAKQKEQYYATESERIANELRTENERTVTQITDTDTDTEPEREAELIPALPENSPPISPEVRFLRQFLDITNVKFTKTEQADELHELYETYGSDLLLEVAAWAAEKVPRNMGHALSMVRSAAATWKVRKDPPREKSFAERLAEA